MTDEQDEGFARVIVGGVASFVGLCFLSVSIWLATTVSTLAKTSATLELSVTNLTKQTEKLGDKVDDIAKEQSKQTLNSYRVTSLEHEIQALKKRIAGLEKQ